MIRKVITPESDTITLQLPVAYIGKQIEIIIFSLDEIQELSQNAPKTFSIIEVDTKDFKFNREELNER